KPYSVILFDEIEKAHSDVFNILLQVLDDGRLTDNQGRVVDFKNTIIIMTSNIGSSYLLEGIKSDGTIDEEAKEEVMRELKISFKPEFLNRIDEIVMFKPLQKNDIFKIIDLQIKEIELKLEDRQIKIEVTDKEKGFILNRSYSSEYGARAVERFLQKEIVTTIGRLLIKCEIKNKDKIDVDVSYNQLAIWPK